jgi:hypothetical protein
VKYLRELRKIIRIVMDNEWLAKDPFVNTGQQLMKLNVIA